MLVFVNVATVAFVNLPLAASVQVNVTLNLALQLNAVKQKNS